MKKRFNGFSTKCNKVKKPSRRSGVVVSFLSNKESPAMNHLFVKIHTIWLKTFSNPFSGKKMTKQKTHENWTNSVSYFGRYLVSNLFSDRNCLAMDFFKIVLSFYCVVLVVEWKKEKETDVKLKVSIDVFISGKFSSSEWSTFWKLKPQMIKFGTKKI